MTNAENTRIERLIKSPLCEIKFGELHHLRYCSYDDLRLLMRYFQCGIGDLSERVYQQYWIWRRIRNRGRRQPAA